MVPAQREATPTHAHPSAHLRDNTQAHPCVLGQGQFAIGLIDTNDKDAADAAAAATGAAAIEAMRQAAGADASLCLMEYSDGFRAALLHGAGAGSLLGGWAFAATVGGETVGTACTRPAAFGTTTLP